VRRIIVVSAGALLCATSCSSGATALNPAPQTALSPKLACLEIKGEYERFAAVASDVLGSATHAVPKLSFINVRDSATANLKAIAASGVDDVNSSAELLAQGISMSGLAGTADESRDRLANGLLLYRSACGTYLGG
jgi:hypothetical protein